MSYVLNLKVRNMEGALERILGVVRYRGFALMGLMATQDREGSRLEVSMTVDGEQRVSNLPKQIAKLFDVETVEMIHQVTPVQKVQVG